MKSKILPSAFSVLFLFFGTLVLSQDYDLIVTTGGDSIACRIDSITESLIYFEMRSQDRWAHTHMAKEKVSGYERNVIDKKLFLYKPGTTIIESLKPEPQTTMKDIQKNAVYAGIFSFAYSRLIPGDNVGFTVSAGLNFTPMAFGDDSFLLMLESTVLTYGPIHFFEPGLVLFYTTENDWPFPYGRAGYRYQGPEGFLFRAGIYFGYLDGVSAVPSLSIGYTF